MKIFDECLLQPYRRVLTHNAAVHLKRVVEQCLRPLWAWNGQCFERNMKKRLKVVEGSKSNHLEAKGVYLKT